MSLMIGAVQLTPQQRILKAVADILGNRNWDGIGSIVMIGGHTVVKHNTNPHPVTTAATNGKDTWYSDEFVGGLSDAELRFLILHESFHVMYKHLTTYQHLHDENPRLANMACDYVINITLVDYDRQTATPNFIKMPSMGLIDEKYRGMDSAQVYKLLKEDEKNGTGNGAKGKGQSGSGGDAGESLDHHDWDGAQEMTEAERSELDKTIDQALRQGALLAGKTGSGGKRVLDGLIESKVDYKEAMREWVLNTCAGNEYSTYQRPNRRYVHAGIFMPSGVTEKVGQLVIACDTSGSIGQRELRQILGEIANISDTVKPDGIRLLYWDTQVCADEYYEGNYQDIASSTKPAGGGGTMVECVPAYLNEKGITPQGVVIITDGCLGGSWGEWSVPTLWVILDNAHATAPIGTTVHVTID